MSENINITEVQEDLWEEYLGLIKPYDSSRRDSKSHYGRLAIQLATAYLQERQEERKMKAREFKQIKGEIEKVLE